MTRSQKILIVAADYSDDLAVKLTKENGCVAYITGIPMSLAHQAVTENWVLPYIYNEIYEIPDPVE